MAVMGQAEEYRKLIRTTTQNGLTNRSDAVLICIYPNESSVLRLIGAVLMEHDEVWSAGKKYFDMKDYFDYLKKSKKSNENSGGDSKAA